jgi:radical SAM superfamily enzyme YgiQ (UPF0313 family)
MELLILDTSKYDDPLSNIWHAAPRYTASFLRRRGFDAAVNFMPVLRETCAPTDAAAAALYFELSDDNVAPDLGFLPAWQRSLPAMRFFVGGTTAGQTADALLRGHPEIDGIVVGECDETLADALARLRAHLPITNVPGLRVRGAAFQPRPPIANLDDLGMMVREGLDELFQQVPPAQRVAYLLAGRGCYARCGFCAVPSFTEQSAPGPRWRGRSVGLIVDEMASLAREFGVRRIVFQDDNFFGPGRAGTLRARQFAAEILERRLEVEYFVTCRLNDVDAETLSAMKTSGLVRVGIGIESLNQRSLTLFDKGYRADAIYPALKVVTDIGIACEVNLIFFEPTMGLADVRRNLAFLEYVERHELLAYSDAYPFKTLLVAPWSRVATKLVALGALESDRATCRFLDQGVAALAEFAGRLHARMPIVFKQRSLVGSKERLGPASGETRQAVHEIASQTARLRSWLGLTVLPSYMRAACDIVERNPDGFPASLAELEASFDAKMAVLRRLGRRLEDIVAESAAETC